MMMTVIVMIVIFYHIHIVDEKGQGGLVDPG